MEKSEALARLAYDEAIRCIAEQQAALESVRGRAATNIGIVSLAASFIGPSVIHSAHGSASAELFLSISVLCFLASIGFSVRVLRSGSGWVFNQSPQQILDDYSESDIADVYRTLAGFFQESIDNNETLLKSRFRAMNAAFILTAIMVLCAVGIAGAGHWSGTMNDSNTQNQPQPSKPTESPPPQPVKPTNPGRVVERESDIPIERKERQS